MSEKILLELKELLEAAIAGDDESREELIDRLDNYLKAEDFEAIRDFFTSVHPADTAQILESYEPEKAWAFVKHLDVETQVKIFNYLDVKFETRIASIMDRWTLTVIMGAMSHDERADLFKELPEEHRSEILSALTQTERDDISKLASYPEGTAGAVMTSDFCALKPDMTSEEALEKLRREAPDKETIYQCYVTDNQGNLIGVVSLRELVMASPRGVVKDIMNHDPIYGRATDTSEDVADIMAKYDLMAVPIINGDDKLVGIVTFDDVHDIIEEEATEDFHRMGSIGGYGESLAGNGYLEASPWVLIQKRLPWLIALVFVNLLSSAGIAYYESTIEAVVALVFFLPLLIAGGGNAGAQSATLMVRALATADIKTKDWILLFGREIIIATILGLSMAMAISLIGIGVFRSGIEVALVVSMTMMAVVIFGSLVGCLLPFLLDRFKLDPATASAPLITSIADVGGIIIYFSIATWFLQTHAVV